MAPSENGAIQLFPATLKIITKPKNQLDEYI